MKLAVVAALISAAAVGARACLDVGFYDTTCPTAETLIQQVVAAAFRNDSGVAPAMIRMHFHDCFVRVSTKAPLLEKSFFVRYSKSTIILV
jgi:peroxidase